MGLYSSLVIVNISYLESVYYTWRSSIIQNFCSKIDINIQQHRGHSYLLALVFFRSYPNWFNRLKFFWSYPNWFTRHIITSNSVKYRYMLINHNLFYDTVY